jgi:ABC-2 type transport system permease protein
MKAVYIKEINAFLSSVIGYAAIGVFLVLLGLFMWVYPDYSVLELPYATMDTLFDMAPLIFLFLIPAVTMRSFSEEFQTGAIELLTTQPLSDWQIVLGKFFACLTLVCIALVPTLIYYGTVYYLGDPVGNLDSGAIAGSYIGLILLSAAFVSIGLFASTLTHNQVVAFLLAALLCFLMLYGFQFISNLPFLVGWADDLTQALGIQSHYQSISRGILDTRDMIYFISLTVAFLWGARLMLDRRRW